MWEYTNVTNIPQSKDANMIFHSAILDQLTISVRRPIMIRRNWKRRRVNTSNLILCMLPDIIDACGSDNVDDTGGNDDIDAPIGVPIGESMLDVISPLLGSGGNAAVSVITTAVWIFSSDFLAT
mmetsp:Transcript_1734/g.2479  ORF Transcript_1734/g.2479 Transcript_1734/m.2479 type:complete len:124 (+) Transcript_1734:1028-1399(+)